MLYKNLVLVNILENVFVFIEILFKMLLFKGGVLIYAEHCTYIYIYMCVCVCVYNTHTYMQGRALNKFFALVRLTFFRWCTSTKVIYRKKPFLSTFTN